MRETIVSILLFIVASLAVGSMFAAIVEFIVLLKKDVASRGGIKKGSRAIWKSLKRKLLKLVARGCFMLTLTD